MTSTKPIVRSDIWIACIENPCKFHYDELRSRRYWYTAWKKGEDDIMDVLLCLRKAVYQPDTVWYAGGIVEPLEDISSIMSEITAPGSEWEEYGKRPKMLEVHSSGLYIDKKSPLRVELDKLTEEANEFIRRQSLFAYELKKAGVDLALKEFNDYITAHKKAVAMLKDVSLTLLGTEINRAMRPNDPYSIATYKR